MTLSADIKYKSNWQQGAVKGNLNVVNTVWSWILTLRLVRRRNKWICALKTSLAELKIFGPGGNPNKDASTTMYTQVPWDEFLELKRDEEARQAAASLQKHMHGVDETKIPKTDYSLQDKNALLSMFHPVKKSEVADGVVPAFSVEQRGGVWRRTGAFY